jgi:hypothetical protein
MKKPSQVIIYALLIMSPVIINYSLFTWEAPGVYKNSSAWLGFLGNYLGFLGAFSIAIMQFKNQKQRDEKQDVENNRSYIILHDFQAPIKLSKVKMHENSRLLETKGYKWLLERVNKSEYDYVKASFLKISQFGNSQVILDCNILVSYKDEEGNSLPELNIQTGVIEQDIEVFIPVVPQGIGIGKQVELQMIVVEYTTLMNERLRYVQDFNKEKEYHSIVKKDGKDEVLFEHSLVGSRWTYPNKLKD